MATRNQIKHYRPYLSATELSFILSLLDVESPLYKKLKLFQFKISESLVVPASSFSKPLSPLEKLGGTTPEETRYLGGEMTPEEEASYLESLMNPPITSI